MPGKSSFAEVSEQIITYNDNVLELLSKMDELTTSDKSSVNIKYVDQFGVLTEYQVPSIGYLKSEINRLNNNMNTLYSIDSNGALIQTANNKFKKIITVDLNVEPNTIDSLSIQTNFKSDKNWFFDGLLNPLLSIELDLEGKVANDVKEVLIRRYIVNFAKNESGDFTPLGQSALNSFNEQFRNKTSITLEDFEYWHKTTPGVVSGLDPNYDQQMFDLEPNELLYDGLFSVLKIEEDTINRKQWFHLDTLEYIITDTAESQQLGIDDELILNQDNASTRYKIIEISTAASNPRIRLERMEGVQPVAVGVSTLKIYSPVVTNKTVKVSIGYDERNVVFVKAVSSNSNIVAKDWSQGVGYWTLDLTLDSVDGDNGSTLEQYYSEKVFDYGEVLKDLVAKKIPDSLAGVPNVALLNQEDFKVVQINTHLTDNADANSVKTKYNKQVTVKSEISQLDEAIKDKQRQSKVRRFSSASSKQKFENETLQLQKKKEGKVNLVTSLARDIISLKRLNLTRVRPKYRVRGFWDMPEGTIVRGGRTQEIVQFKVRYRYQSTDGKETPVDSFKIRDGEGKTKSNAAFSNWIEVLTDVRQRVRDEGTGEYFWAIQDVADADTPNINQLDIALQQGEKVEVQVKSLSEVGYPESPIESDWSDTITVGFPDDLNDVLGEDDFILREAEGEELKASINTDLSAKGLDEHLNDAVIIEDKTYFHNTDAILSGFRDNNNNSIDLFTYLKSLTDKITSLEEKVARSKGELKITVLRNNEEYVIKNGSEVAFTVECEDYLQKLVGDGIPPGRVYSNDIYTVKDFVLRIDNVAQDSPLGLLSGKSYYQNSGFFNTSAPQVFFVNDRDELLFNNSSGSTRTQLNNQFMWNVNYDTMNDNTIVKLSDNVGNNFVSDNSNSLTSYLSSTEYNVGYSENTIVDFLSSDNSLLEPDKWIDTTVSVSSNTKLLTTVHPVVQSLQDIVETNSEKVKTVDAGKDNGLIVPLNIYFKMNSLDPNVNSGNNYEYINLNNNKKSTKHIKKLKFHLENEADNRPFVFTVKFTINRSKISLQKINANTKVSLSPKTK